MSKEVISLLSVRSACQYSLHVVDGAAVVCAAWWLVSTGCCMAVVGGCGGALLQWCHQRSVNQPSIGVYWCQWQLGQGHHGQSYDAMRRECVHAPLPLSLRYAAVSSVIGVCSCVIPVGLIQIVARLCRCQWQLGQGHCVGRVPAWAYAKCLHAPLPLSLMCLLRH